MKFYRYKENTNPITHILLESKEEVLIFLSNKEIFWQQDIENFKKLFLTNDETLRQKMASHTMFRTPISELAKQISWLYDFKLIADPEYFSNMYNDGILKFQENFGNVFVNKVGGYCNFEAFPEEDYEEVSEFKLEDIFTLGETNYSFNYDTSENKMLVLENDHILDTWTVNHFKGKVPYIVNLRSVMATNKFEEILNEFSKNYSKKIFVYTTGLDYEQMIDYVSRAIDCGFNDFEWVFNGFQRETEFKKFLDTKNIIYKIKNI